MKRTRKGFTLIELLIVIAIVAILAAAMTVSGSSANAAAKASTIYNNINAIKTAAVLYQLQAGNGFKESDVNAEKLKSEKLLDLDLYNKDKDNNESLIKYTITAGTATGGGAYVVCNFANEADRQAIAKSLKNYKNIRFDDNDYIADVTAIGAYLYHDTPYEQDKDAAYEVEMTFK